MDAYEFGIGLGKRLQVLCNPVLPNKTRALGKLRKDREDLFTLVLPLHKGIFPCSYAPHDIRKAKLIL